MYSKALSYNVRQLATVATKHKCSMYFLFSYVKIVTYINLHMKNKLITSFRKPWGRGFQILEGACATPGHHIDTALLQMHSVISWGKKGCQQTMSLRKFILIQSHYFRFYVLFLSPQNCFFYVKAMLFEMTSPGWYIFIIF